MAREVTSRSFTAEKHFRSQASVGGIYDAQRALENVSYPALQFPLSVLFHHSSSVRFSYRRDKQAKFGNLPKSNALTEIWNHWVEK